MDLWYGQRCFPITLHNIHDSFTIWLTQSLTVSVWTNRKIFTFCISNVNARNLFTVCISIDEIQTTTKKSVGSSQTPMECHISPPPKKKINEPWYSIHNLKKNSGSTCGVSSKMRWWRNVEGTVHFNQWFEACIENEFWMPREYGTWLGTRSLHKEHTHFRWCQVQSTCLNILKLFWQFCLKRY